MGLKKYMCIGWEATLREHYNRKTVLAKMWDISGIDYHNIAVSRENEDRERRDKEKQSKNTGIIACNDTLDVS